MFSKYTFQDPASEYARNLIELHHFIMFILIIVFFVVAMLLLRVIVYFADTSSKYYDSLASFDVSHFTSFSKYSNYFFSFSPVVYSSQKFVNLFNKDLASKNTINNYSYNLNYALAFTGHADNASVLLHVETDSPSSLTYMNFFDNLNKLPFLFFENVRHGTKLEIF